MTDLRISAKHTVQRVSQLQNLVSIQIYISFLFITLGYLGSSRPGYKMADIVFMQWNYKSGNNS